ncbi:MAG: flagellar protein export ATPase FliI [bacterium]|nr:flagellar protein export ATPase FliI [bacterium]
MLSDITAKYDRIASSSRKVKLKGKIDRVIGLVIESVGPTVSIGEKCYIRTPGIEEVTTAEVVGFRDKKVLLMPIGELIGIGPGSEVIATGEPLVVPVGPALVGRILDGYGNPIDGKGPILFEKKMSVQNKPPKPLERKLIDKPLSTGIKAIDSLITLGKGQRVGIFAGSGVGKSILIGMIARNTTADVNVIALIGERGREVNEFIQKDLGEEGLKRSVVIVVTSDEAALTRVKGGMVATTIAEYFRDQGKDVMFLMDSATRIAQAQREIGLSIGEPPTTKGYPPSVFAMLPRLIERAGRSKDGSITAVYAVLVEADDMNEPISDAMRSILDGHVALSRKLASMNHYPAIDVLESISRLMKDVVDDQHLDAAARISSLVASYRDAEDLINIGAYSEGSNPDVDIAIRMNRRIKEFLKQGIWDKVDFDEIIQNTVGIAQESVAQ